MATLGIHAIWTTYMTWPPGDRRKHWSPLFDFYGRLIDRGGKLQLPDENTRRVATELSKEPPKFLDDEEIKTVADTISEHVSWPDHPSPDKPMVYAATIEANHVHLLLGPVKEDIGKCVGRLKGTSSSALLQMPANKNRKRIWTSGYWKVFLFNPIALFGVKDYVDDHLRRKGHPLPAFPWISTLPAFLNVAGKETELSERSVLRFPRQAGG